MSATLLITCLPVKWVVSEIFGGFCFFFRTPRFTLYKFPFRLSREVYANICWKKNREKFPEQLPELKLVPARRPLSYLSRFSSYETFYRGHLGPRTFPVTALALFRHRSLSPSGSFNNIRTSAHDQFIKNNVSFRQFITSISKRLIFLRGKGETDCARGGHN